MEYTEQLDRIKEKLQLAKKKDIGFKVFGAGSHKYKMKEPLSEQEVLSFESKYSVSLPVEYKLFITSIGNGGAGPFYGIYPLGNFGYVDIDSVSMSSNCFINSKLTVDQWTSSTSFYDNEENIESVEFDRMYNSLFTGLMTIGTEGCSYQMMLCLNGPDKGRVVYIDQEMGKPFITFEKNFLDWYERWLEEILNDYEFDWFGYTRGGSDEELFILFDNSNDDLTKEEALAGLSKLPRLTQDSIDRLFELCISEKKKIRHLALKMLTKFNYQIAIEPLKQHILGDEDDCKIAFQSIFWYARANSGAWIQEIYKRILAITDQETFQFGCYLLQESKIDYSETILPFTSHVDEKIRDIVFHSLGCIPNKSRFTEYFVKGLYDESPKVVHTVLQSLHGVTSKELLVPYKKVLERFKTNDNYVLSAVIHNLGGIGIDAIEVVSFAINHAEVNTARSAKKLLDEFGEKRGVFSKIFNRLR